MTGTRADFGLMKSTLCLIRTHPSLKLDIVVTGMHLSRNYGYTVDEIQDSGFNIRAKFPVALEPANGATMGRNIGKLVADFVDEWDADKPDVVMLLGDRGEMLAGAIAAVHLNLPVVHVHGGERSGSIDESVRHAISKLSHFHFVATDASKKRLIRMGERRDKIWVTGAPGLDGLTGLATSSRLSLCQELGLDNKCPVALFLFHPVLQEDSQASGEVRLILEVLIEKQVQIVALMPNSDAGSAPIRAVLQEMKGHDMIRVLTHLGRQRFVSWMAQCDVMVGNSSAGIIEAATFGTPVLNFGSRQTLRERNANVLDVMSNRVSILEALDASLERVRFPSVNIYGDGYTSSRIVDLLLNLGLANENLRKTNVY